MPVKTRIPIRRLSQLEFGEIAFEVMKQTFAIHKEIGRFFDERIYKCELARRLSNVSLEEPIEINFGSFSKTVRFDVLVEEAAIFEFKLADAFSGRHRAQLLQYLMLTDKAHGKLINLGLEDVQHEFVNSGWRCTDRTTFKILDSRWSALLPRACQLREFLTDFLLDIGTGLDVSIYEAAVEHCFGGSAKMEGGVQVRINGNQVCQQTFRLISPGIAVLITTFDKNLELFETQARKLLAHVDLQAIAWVKINLKEVSFVMLSS